MSSDDYSTIENIVREMRQELKELDNQIKYNLQCIKEADVYANLFTVSEPEEYKLFSPRNSENVHKDEIEKARREKKSCEKQNEELNARRTYLFRQIQDLENILTHKDDVSDGYTALTIQEEDRQRIARDLHDTSLQNLAHLIHKIELSSLYMDEDVIKAKLELSIVSNVLKKTIDEIRNTIFDLRPMTFDDFGFKTALERLLGNINENQRYIIETDIDEVSCEKNIVLVSVYRVVQECLNNIVKHADADKITFSCKNKGNKCIVVIEDDGKGFETGQSPEGKHFGLSLMRERIRLVNGKIEISSESEKGTRIQIEVPI